MPRLFHSQSGFFEKHPAFFDEPDGKALFFLGIGGASVSSLARYARHLGFRVSGSDRRSSEITDALTALGIPVSVSHRSENLPDGTDLLIYSLAVAPDTPELIKAQICGIPAVSRAEFLGWLMMRYPNRIGVSGSHGKSTVTAMIARIFTDAGEDPTVFSGAGLSPSLPSYRFGGKEYLLYEACEYRDSFLCFSPTAAVALNLELDHTDYFSDLDALKASFLRSLSGAERAAIVSSDDPALADLLPSLPREKIRTFGYSPKADYRITDAFEGAFTLSAFGEPLGRFSLSVPGAFQFANAAAAIAAACEYGISAESARVSLSRFCGIPRRMQLLGRLGAFPVYYDYAHHPTEILSVISALQKANKSVTAVFRPHTFSRTRALWFDFIRALASAHRVILLPIDPVREEPAEGISSERLALEIGERAVFLPEEEIPSLPDLLLQEGGAAVLLGAGDLGGALHALSNCKGFHKNT